MSTFDQINATAELQAVAQEILAGAEAMIDSLNSIVSGDDDDGGDPAQLLDQSMAEFKAWFDRGVPLWVSGRTIAQGDSSAPANAEPGPAPSGVGKITKAMEVGEMEILTIRETCEALITRRAEALQKGDPSLTKPQAIAKVLETPDGIGLYSAHKVAGMHGTFTDGEAVRYAKLALQEAADRQAARHGERGNVEKGFSELPMCTLLWKMLTAAR